MTDKKPFVSIKDSPIIRYWDYERNTADPATIASKSGKRYWWICPECGCSHEKVAINMHMSPRCKDCGMKASIKTSAAIRRAKSTMVADCPALLKYWDYENNTCSPDNITIGNSYKKFYWICSKCGKSHERTPYNEQKSTLCRSCGSKKGIANGYRARIAKSHSIADDPVLSKCWDSENNTADPTRLAYRSNRKFKWICPECGNGFERTAKHMIDGQLCNDCTLKKRTKTHHDNYMKTAQSVADDPELLKCWDYEHNTEDPHDVPQKSNNYFYWKCPECGKSFRRTGNNQYASLRLCDDCAMNIRIASHNDYRMKHSEKVSDRPNLMAMWDFDKNDVAPEKVLAHATRVEYWWKCPLCGKSEKATPARKYEANTCWDCGNKIGGISRRKGDVQRKGSFGQHHPHLAKEWHPTLNGDTTPFDITSGCGEEFYWQCRYGHVFKTTPNERVKRHAGCPICRRSLRTSFTEQVISFYLDKVTPTLPNHDIGGFEFDAYLKEKNVVIEYDGQWWHSRKDTKLMDLKKDKYCEENGIRLLRVKETERTDKVENGIIYAKRHGTDYRWLIQTICKELGLVPPDDIDVERDSPKILERVTPVLYEKSLHHKRPDLLPYWNEQANLPFTSKNVACGSHVESMWHCPKCGHEWKEPVFRVSGRKNICPKCRENEMKLKGRSGN